MIAPKIGQNNTIQQAKSAKQIGMGENVLTCFSILDILKCIIPISLKKIDNIFLV